MLTYAQVIKHYAKELKEVTHIPQKEVEMLLLFLLNKNTIWLHLNYNEECRVEDKLKKLVQKRKQFYPIEYIIKKVSFYGETFLINEGVLIPRPETEILVEKAYETLKNIKSSKVIEIGTGSGIISVMLALLIDDIKIVAVDINEKALNLAKQNAKRFNVEHKITFLKSDLFDKVENKNFDMCISNPPYIKNNFNLPPNVKYEPSNALFGGDLGDELLKNIIDKTYKYNIKYLYCEMGYDQKQPIQNYLKNFSIANVEFYKDLDKLDRGFCIEFWHPKFSLSR